MEVLVFKFIMGIIIGYAVVVIYGPDIGFIIWHETIELIREVVKAHEENINRSNNAICCRM